MKSLLIILFVLLVLLGIVMFSNEPIAEVPTTVSDTSLQETVIVETTSEGEMTAETTGEMPSDSITATDVGMEFPIPDAGMAE